jgi:aldehyde dehydrogenase (NAD+)
MSTINVIKSFPTEVAAVLEELGVLRSAYAEGDVCVHTPISGELIGRVRSTTGPQCEQAIEVAYRTHLAWRRIPAPRRGELVRLLGEELRKCKIALGRLVSLEVGKILSEGLGEVQEMIDICDFAVGLSRQLYGLTIASERTDHRMMESWHPLGVVGVISAFNFPVAVWSWNAALALICGDSLVWKPSEKTPLTALACQEILQRAIDRCADAPQGLSQIVIGSRAVGETVVDHPRVALVSATGSTRMGREVGARVAQRFGRTILELGGNNAVVVSASADLELAMRAVVFGAAGTAGQRCTTTRRLIIHRSIRAAFVERLRAAYRRLPIGNPLAEGTLIGPLVDEAAFNAMQAALVAAGDEGGTVYGGGRVMQSAFPNAFYVEPAIVAMPAQTALVSRETFAPIVYVLEYDRFEEAIELNNAVPQGLSSAVFTNDLREAELFMSYRGSDCGIVNVNIGTSGAEIGGAFGGEKETGGGRESGTDAWKSYMRRTTNTINHSHDLPLAQGVEFYT